MITQGGATVATFALIHGAGDVGWYWHLVERELTELLTGYAASPQG